MTQPDQIADSAVGIFGAGSIGCHIAARLAATGTPVHLIGRDRIAQEIATHGLSASDHLGGRWQADADKVVFASAVDARFQSLDVVLVCVKSAATMEAAQALQELEPGSLVISLQNGIHNAQELAKALPHCKVLAGMVPFNVVNQDQAHFHQGSEGSLEIQDDAAVDALDSAFTAAGLSWRRHSDMLAVMWSKLILNLNNSVNALSGVPLKTELSQRSYRRCLAMAQTEALALMKQAGIPAAKIIAIPTAWLPVALNVPDWLFRLLGNKMLQIDPQARSSMWEDLQQGRRTEIDWLNGEIVRLAQSIEQKAPVNRQLISLIRDAENGGRADWSGAELLHKLQKAAST